MSCQSDIARRRAQARSIVADHSERVAIDVSKTSSTPARARCTSAWMEAGVVSHTATIPTRGRSRTSRPTSRAVDSPRGSVVPSTTHEGATLWTTSRKRDTSLQVSPPPVRVVARMTAVRWASASDKPTTTALVSTPTDPSRRSRLQSILAAPVRTDSAARFRKCWR